jgi:hypothetical protein
VKNDRSRENAAFADWLRSELVRRGYDLSGPRSGGKGNFANDSGISRPSISRMLDPAGRSITDIGILTQLAESLQHPLGDILVRVGVIDSSELRAVQDPQPGPRRITPQEAAAALGITDTQSLRLFVSMAETLQRQPPPETGGQTAADQ